MARTYSEPLPLGSVAPAFDLPVANPDCDDRGGDRRRLDDYQDASVVVVVFMCNHCPFVIHARPELIRIAAEYANRGVQLIGINSNDANRYPSDSFEKMREEASVHRFPFPYLYDESQEIARSYGAVCTPDIYVYGADRVMVYHGQLDATRPGGEDAHGHDLRKALDEVLETGSVIGVQSPSIGCNIKWKETGSEA